MLGYQASVRSQPYGRFLRRFGHGLGFWIGSYRRNWLSLMKGLVFRHFLDYGGDYCAGVGYDLRKVLAPGAQARDRIADMG